MQVGLANHRWRADSHGVGEAAHQRVEAIRHGRAQMLDIVALHPRVFEHQQSLVITVAQHCGLFARVGDDHVHAAVDATNLRRQGVELLVGNLLAGNRELVANVCRDAAQLWGLFKQFHGRMIRLPTATIDVYSGTGWL